MNHEVSDEGTQDLGEALGGPVPQDEYRQTMDITDMATGSHISGQTPFLLESLSRIAPVARC